MKKWRTRTTRHGPRRYGVQPMKLRNLKRGFSLKRAKMGNVRRLRQNCVIERGIILRGMHGEMQRSANFVLTWPPRKSHYFSPDDVSGLQRIIRASRGSLGHSALVFHSGFRKIGHWLISITITTVLRNGFMAFFLMFSWNE